MREGKIQKYKKVLKYVKNTSSQESTREEKNVFKKIKHPLHKNEKIEAGFHYIWIKFVNASLVNGITMNLITPSGPKCSGSIMVFKKNMIKTQ